jgi:hypothetical protein
VSSQRPQRVLLWAIPVAVLSLWVSFAVVAGATRNSPRSAAHAQPAQPMGEAAPIGLALSPAPALRVRSAVLAASAPQATGRRAQHTHRARARATEPPAPAAPAAAMSAPEAPAATPAPTNAVQPTPSPRPAAKPRPTITAEPKRPSRPDFDQSQPDGFDTSG